MSGGVVGQGHASLLKPRTRCGEDAGSASRTAGVSRLVVVGSPWRVSLDNPSCRTFLQKPASKGNSSTIATPRKQCQTQILREALSLRRLNCDLCNFLKLDLPFFMSGVGLVSTLAALESSMRS